MEPVLKAGDLCIVDPNDAASAGDLVIVQTQAYEGDPGQTYVKILVARTATKIVLSQTNPAATLEIPRDIVSSVHRVLSVSDLFSV
jgi:phage repressor protein C with HTH and peptisase S24 domain